MSHTDAPWTIYYEKGVYWIQWDGISIGMAMLRDDAHLMAAAPELLDALRGLLAFVEDRAQFATRIIADERIANARAIVAKATGQ